MSERLTKNMIILCGYPGSGKSTIHSKEFPTYTRISQDLYKGSRMLMEKEFERALLNNESMVIDRVNHTIKQRQYFLVFGKRYGYNIEVIWLDVDPNLCIDRIRHRIGHETIPGNTPILKIAQIVNRFKTGFEKPTFQEGYDIIEVRKFNANSI